jgi:hypothetical protein
MTSFRWLAIPSVDRMVTWIGPSKRVVVTGLDGVDLGNVPCSFDLPPGAEVHEVPAGASPTATARELGGVLFTVPEATATKEPERIGYTVIRVLPELEGKLWGPVTRAYLRSLRPSSVRVVRPGQFETSDAKIWRVTVRLDADDRIALVDQEVDVDLPDGVENGWHLGQLLRTKQ